MATLIESPLTRLTPEQIEQIGREFDAIHDEVKAELGDRDRRYITSMIEMHRRLVVLARVLLLASRYRPAWIAGTTTLSLAKILENMEIGHNVMHGQWDWMNDPQINSSTWDWDSASTPEAWKHSHNYVHHTYTNIRGKDRDLGYEIMRIDPHQKWNPVYLFQPFYNLILAGFFEWGVAAHDLDFDAIRSGEKSKAEVRRQLKGMAGKARSQIVKDYVAWPLISGLAMAAVDLALETRAVARRRAKLKRKVRRGRRPVKEALTAALEGGIRSFRSTQKANFTANIVRNVWAYAIIFCGHFPDQTYTFSQAGGRGRDQGRVVHPPAAGRGEHRGQPALPRHQRQPRLPGRASPLPRHAQHAVRRDRPARARDLRALRTALQHRPFGVQLGTVQRTILRLAFPGGKPRPKPGPYRGDDALRVLGRRPGPDAAAA